VANELKRQKEEIRETLLNKIEAINGKENLNKIFDILNNLNENLNCVDGRIPNVVDDILLKLTKDQKNKIKRLITDVLDNFDKSNKDGTPKYTKEQTQAILSAVEEINSICDKSFWEKFLFVFGIGS
jgi:translation elongation factor EF-Tu-like GTPase